MKNKVIFSLLAPMLFVSLQAQPARAEAAISQIGDETPIAMMKGSAPRDKKPTPTPTPTPKPPRPKPGPQDEGDGD